MTAQEIAPLRGKHAHKLGESQGLLWRGIVAVGTIEGHVDIGEALDRRGDALMAEHRRHLARALRLARAEHATQTAELLVELIASAGLIVEVDDAEDFHRRACGSGATDAERAERASHAIHMLLLGQREAEAAPQDYELPYPMDGVMAPGICGAEREPMGAIRFAPCDQPAGHELDGGVHVYLSVAPEGEVAR